jgi:hypothetical protein
MENQIKEFTDNECLSDDEYYNCSYSKDGYDIIFALKNNLIHIKLTKNNIIYEAPTTINDFTGYYLFGSHDLNALYEMICESATSNEEVKSISIHEYGYGNFIRINFNEKQFYQNFQIVIPQKMIPVHNTNKKIET